MTGVEDEEFRSRAYALGVDLFWLKPDTHQNMQSSSNALNHFSGRDAENGFRGIQSKSLMDILQMECLSQSSTRLPHHPRFRSWEKLDLHGDLIDAGNGWRPREAAFRRILEWKSGHL